MDSPPNSELVLEDLDALPSSSSEVHETVEEKILSLRNQLRDSYEIVIKTRDTLSNISFERMKENEGEGQIKKLFEKDVEEVLNAHSLKEKLERLQIKIKSHARGNNAESQFQKTSSVYSFFRALDDLDAGIKKIEGHKTSLRSLNSDVVREMNRLEEEIQKNRMEMVVLETNSK